MLRTYLLGNSPQNLFSSILITLQENIIILLLIYLLCIKSYTLPLAFSVFFIKSMALGFSSALILESFGIKGLWTLATHLLPQNVFIFTALLLPLCMDLRRKTPAKKHLIFFAKLSGIVLLGCLIEALIFR